MLAGLVVIHTMVAHRTVETAVTKKNYASGDMPYEDKVCHDCSAAAGERSRIEYMPHVCFDCPHLQAKLHQMGWSSWGTWGVTDLCQLLWRCSMG